jgi:glutathione S-transferase
MTPILGLFPHLSQPTNSEVDRLFAQLHAGLAHVDHYLAGACAAGDAPTLADCALAPILFWAGEVARMFGRADPLSARPRLARYDRAMAGHSVFGHLVAAMADDLAALRRLR